MLFASATPIVSGGTDRYRQIGTELQPHMDEYEALNRRYEVQSHAYWISHARSGVDIGVSVYDISAEGLAQMKTREWDTGSSHDRWWLDFVHQVNGVDMLQEPAHAAAPEPVFSWSA